MRNLFYPSAFIFLALLYSCTATSYVASQPVPPEGGLPATKQELLAVLPDSFQVEVVKRIGPVKHSLCFNWKKYEEEYRGEETPGLYWYRVRFPNGDGYAVGHKDCPLGKLAAHRDKAFIAEGDGCTSPLVEGEQIPDGLWYVILDP